MAFDPVTHLTLNYSGRSAAVFRELCLRHEVSHTDYTGMPRVSIASWIELTCGGPTNLPIITEWFYR